MDTTADSRTAALEAQLTDAFLGKYREILDGMPEGKPTWVTSGGPAGGVHGTLADVTAEEASTDVSGSTIAAHAFHLRWAIDLVNLYFAGKEQPSDWSESWRVRSVTEPEWQDLRGELKRAGDELLSNAERGQDWKQRFAMEGAFASYGHAAYHLGALRQLKKAVRSAT